MSWWDGRRLVGTHAVATDVAVVGSGPAGSVVAEHLVRAGMRVLVIEAGPRRPPEVRPPDALHAMGIGYRHAGAAIALGLPPMPIVQGRQVGGSGAVNGAICWRLPRDVWDGWVAEDPGVAEALPWEVLEAHTDAVEARLGVAPTAPEVAGRKNQLLARGAEALGVAHRPIRRNVRGCEGRGRCLLGCPIDAKQGPERTHLADARAGGATVLHDASVRGIVHRRGRVEGVEVHTRAGGRVRVRAPRVVLAASAIQTPQLLLASGLGQGPVGQHLQGHPGVSLTARFADPVRAWEGATQGHEVVGLRREGLKFEALGHAPGLLAGRLPGVGRDWAARVAALDHHLDWGVAVRATGEGRVRRWLGRPLVTWSPSTEDLRRFRRGVAVLARLAFAAGATEVHPHVRGEPAVVQDPAWIARFEVEGPTARRAYTGAMTHLFGTCRLGSDAGRSVVGLDLHHHHVAGLAVADSSVFPSNTGVNPQIAIMAVAARCAEQVVARG